jgi:GT2 family glycosyltransferase
MSSDSPPEPRVAPPLITIVIPNWNGAHLLPICLESLRRQTYRTFRVLVVDNGSTDASLTLLAERHPEVDVFALPRNTGFAAAVNVGIRASKTEWVALLNNDTEVDRDWLAAAMKQFAERPDCAFGSSKLLRFDDRERIESLADGFSFFGVPFKIGENLHERDAPRTPFEILSACAAASFYRRSMLEDIGFFDEDFFAYVEDIDVSLRAILAGYRGISLLDAKVYHMGTASSGGGPSAFTVRLTTRNVWSTIFKCMPGFALPAIAAYSLCAQAGLIAHTLVTGRRPWLRQNLSSYFGGLGEAVASAPATMRKRQSVVRRGSPLFLLRKMAEANRIKREISVAP